MNSRLWINRVLSALAGALFLLALQVSYVADNFIVSKDEVAARQAVDQTYAEAAMNPFDEMNGEGP